MLTTKHPTQICHLEHNLLWSMLHIQLKFLPKHESCSRVQVSETQTWYQHTREHWPVIVYKEPSRASSAELVIYLNVNVRWKTFKPLSTETSVSHTPTEVWNKCQMFVLCVSFCGLSPISPPPLCGATPASSDYVAKQGDKVAARVKAVDGDEQWILAEVVSYNHSTNKWVQVWNTPVNSQMFSHRHDDSSPLPADMKWTTSTKKEKSECSFRFAFSNLSTCIISSSPHFQFLSGLIWCCDSQYRSVHIYMQSLNIKCDIECAQTNLRCFYVTIFHFSPYLSCLDFIKQHFHGDHTSALTEPSAVWQQQ